MMPKPKRHQRPDDQAAQDQPLVRRPVVVRGCAWTRPAPCGAALRDGVVGHRRPPRWCAGRWIGRSPVVARGVPARDRAAAQPPCRFMRFAIRSSTTAGSARVEVSPSAPKSFSAILRRMRRMILPDRVLGRPGANWIRSGLAIGPISLRTQSARARAQLLGRLHAAHQGDVGVDALALDGVRVAHHRRLGHVRVRDQRALDLGGAEPVARDVEHVVHPPRDPVVAVRVPLHAVAGEVEARDTARSRSPRSACGRPRRCASARASESAMQSTPSATPSRRSAWPEVGVHHHRRARPRRRWWPSRA